VSIPATWPNKEKVENLAKRHAEHTAKCDQWARLRLLRGGGDELKKQASLFLVPRMNEPADVTNLRTKLFTYNNVLGPALGWYTSALFKQAPVVEFRPKRASGAAGKGQLRGDAARRYERFMKDCDRKGEAFLDWCQNFFEELALCGTSWVLVDRPAVTAPNRLVEREMDLQRGHLVRFQPEQVIGWSEDAEGKLEWVKIHAVTCESDPFGDAVETDHWYIYTRTEFVEYVRVRSGNSKEDAWAQMAEGSPRLHPFAADNRVPLRRYCVPERLWLGDRVYLPVQAHLNQENSVAYQTFMGLLAQPVITGAPNFASAQGVSENGTIILPQGATYGWSEPAGTVLGIGRERAAELREEIYRQMHLIQQGRDSSATPAAQSGYSKEIDRAPTNDVLEGFGDIIMAAMDELAGDVIQLAGDTDAVTVRIDGFRFEEPRVLEKLDVLDRVKESQIPSDTLIRELELDIALDAIPDRDQPIIDQVKREIESAPTMSERQQQQKDEAWEAAEAGLRLPA
jgi:hypothetical protein